jgi:nitrite reductase/ring-hydroxylating ferredoxin subunit
MGFDRTDKGHQAVIRGALDDRCADCAVSPNARVAVPTVGGLDRRTFLSRAMLSAAGLALAACGLDSATAPFSGTASLNVADYPALQTVGGVALVSLNGSPVALIRSSDTSIAALSRVCPHQGATVNQSGSGFVCPRHGAQFSLTGQWLGGQRTSGLQSYSTTFDPATGTITVG